MNDVIAQFRDAIRAAGLMPPEVILGDGKLHRFASSGKRGDDAGCYVLHLDGLPAGWIGDWRTGISQNWRIDMGRALTPDEEVAHRARVELMKRERETAEAKERAEAARKAAAIWKSALPVAPDQPYLLGKSATPVATLREIDAREAGAILGYAPKCNGRLLQGRLLVAPVKVGNAISTLELIDEAGFKSALARGAKTGGYWAAQSMPIHDEAGLTLIIGEGVVTVLSSREATGFTAVAALCARNLTLVAKQMRQRYPSARIVILSDLGNGAEDAEAAAHVCDGLVAVPDFGGERPEGYKDFNDMARHCGLESVARAIKDARAARWTGGAANSSSAARSASENIWADPVPLPAVLTPVQTFNDALLPGSIRDWVVDIAERMQCPPDFVAVGAMVALSSVIGRKAAIAPKQYDDWLVVPNLWGAVVGRPGVMKSPALSEVMRPLQALESAAKQKHAESVREAQVKAKLGEMTARLEDEEIEKLVRSGSRTEAEQLLIARSAAVGRVPPLRRYKVTDATVEALGEILAENPWGTLAYRDELHGLLCSLDKSGQEGARAFYLQGYDGNQDYTFDRIGRGRNLHIPAVCIAMLGGIQPGKLQAYVHDAVRGGAGDDGLLQRFSLLVWPEVTSEWKNVDRRPDVAARDRAFATFMRLDALQPEAHADSGPPSPAIYRFTREAQEVFDSWRERFEPSIRSDEHQPAMQSHLSKYRKLVPAVALVIGLAEGEQTVSAGALTKALDWADYLQSHAARAYGACEDPPIDAAGSLLAKIRGGAVLDRFSERDIYIKGWAHLRDRESVRSAAAMLCDLHHLRAVEHRPGPTGGRPTTFYSINPKTLSGADSNGIRP